MNASKEHILLNAAGGRLISKKLLCKTCNSKYGDDIDSELAQQLNHYANILLIKRSRGHPAHTTAFSESTGQKYVIDHNGIPSLDKPIVKEVKDGNHIELHIQARNMKEFVAIVNGYGKKYPQLNTSEVIKNAQNIELFDREPLKTSLSIGGSIANQSIAKTAIEFYLYKRHNRLYISEIIEALKQKKANIYVEPFIPIKLPMILDDDAVVHFISLRGDKKNGILYCYVDYFGINGFIVKLNTHYTGPNISEDYTYDVLNGTRIISRLEEIIPQDEVRGYKFTYCEQSFSLYKERIARLLLIAHKRQELNQINRIVDESYNEAIKKGGTDQEINSFFIATVSDKMTKFIFRRIKE
jgi:hypothetical protein